MAFHDTLKTSFQNFIDTCIGHTDISGIGDGKVKGAIGALDSELTASDNLKFNFSTDGEGNYGYLGADGSFIPFKSGGGAMSVMSAYQGTLATSQSVQFNANVGEYLLAFAAKNGSTVTFSGCDVLLTFDTTGYVGYAVSIYILRATSTTVVLQKNKADNFYVGIYHGSVGYRKDMEVAKGSGVYLPTAYNSTPLAQVQNATVSYNNATVGDFYIFSCLHSNAYTDGFTINGADLVFEFEGRGYSAYPVKFALVRAKSTTIGFTTGGWANGWYSRIYGCTVTKVE